MQKNIPQIAGGFFKKPSQPLSLKKRMGESQLRISLDLNMGKAAATGWGSDLSYDYMRINAEYTT